MGEALAEFEQVVTEQERAAKATGKAKREAKENSRLSYHERNLPALCSGAAAEAGVGGGDGCDAGARRSHADQRVLDPELKGRSG